jgi:selenocysteine lyase/cysteine desulfurase
MSGISIDEYASRFTDEPGYLDFARVGPIGTTAVAEELAMVELLGRARFGSLDGFGQQDLRVRQSVAALTGFAEHNIVFQPNTSSGLLHAMFGLTGSVALSLGEFPALTVSAVRSGEALHALSTSWIDTDEGRVTPGNLKKQLTKAITAVAVSLVDFRTGYLVDLEGIRQVIGDRLLIVDAAQGFTAVEAPYGVADVVVSGGRKWARAGGGTGFLALSDRAIERLTPVMSGYSATTSTGTPVDEVPPPAAGAAAYSMSIPDPIAMARFAAALEEIADVGVAAIRDRIIDATGRIIDVADEFGIPVVSSRNLNERAGIVVLQPADDQMTVLAASLHNHGITATRRDGTVRLSAHVSTTEASFEMLRASFLGFASAITI